MIYIGGTAPVAGPGGASIDTHTLDKSTSQDLFWISCNHLLSDKITMILIIKSSEIPGRKDHASRPEKTNTGEKK
jgi:hypothetical protein